MDHLRHQKHISKEGLENNFMAINVSINGMDKFEKKKELAKKRKFTKNTWFDWYDWLINYISEAMKKTVGGVKGQIMRLLKPKIIVNQNVPKLYMEVEKTF